MLRACKTLLVTIIVLISLLLPTKVDSAGWLGTWAHRCKLTIDNGDIDSNLTDFPVLVYLSSSSGRNNDDVTFIFDEVGANDKKIAITEDDGTTECYVEIERWDNGNEKAWLWVKVPSVASGADTELYLYYDNAQADNNAYVGDTNDVVAENVWDANFVFVSHMQDDPDNTAIRDSTGNNNDGAKKGAGEPAEAASIISAAQELDGLNDYVGIADNDVFDLITLVSVEAWVYPTLESEAYGRYWMREGAYMLGQQLNDETNVRWELTGFPTTVLNSGAGTVTVNDWNYIVGTYDKNGGANNRKIYINGSNVASRTDASNLAIVAKTSFLGTNSSADTLQCFKGVLDEIRVSNAARPVEWVKATYESGRDDLLDFGAEEDMPVDMDAPTGFIVIDNGSHTINATWTKDAGATNTLIRVKRESYPTSVTDGELVYFGADDNCTDEGYSLETTTYYFRAWSWNAGDGYSSDYAEDNIGGTGMIMMAFLFLALGCNVIGFVFKKQAFAYGAIGGWILLAIYAYNLATMKDFTDIYFGMFWFCFGLVIVSALEAMALRPKVEKQLPDNPDSLDVYITKLEKDREKRERYRLALEGDTDYRRRQRRKEHSEQSARL